jgi:hypothetical protein
MFMVKGISFPQVHTCVIHSASGTYPRTHPLDYPGEGCFAGDSLKCVVHFLQTADVEICRTVLPVFPKQGVTLEPHTRPFPSLVVGLEMTVGDDITSLCTT